MFENVHKITGILFQPQCVKAIAIKETLFRVLLECYCPAQKNNFQFCDWEQLNSKQDFYSKYQNGFHTDFFIAIYQAFVTEKKEKNMYWDV